MTDDERKKLTAELEKLKSRLADRESAMPAHSANPSILMEIEELEEQIEEIEKKLQ